MAISLDTDSYRIGDRVTLVAPAGLEEQFFFDERELTITGTSKWSEAQHAMLETDELLQGLVPYYTVGAWYWQLERTEDLAVLYWDDVTRVAMEDGVLSVSLIGAFGEPLKLLIDLLLASDTFAAFSPAGRVYLFQRRSVAEQGDTWAEIGYVNRNDSTRATRDNQGAGMAAFAIARNMEVSLVRAFANDPTEDDKAAMINTLSTILREVLEQDLALGIQSWSLQGFGIDDSSSPVLLAGTVAISMGFGV